MNTLVSSAIVCFILLISGNLLPSETCLFSEQNYSVVLHPESKLSIVGRTNVNQFRCKYTQSLQPDVLQVSVRYDADSLYLSNALIQLQSIWFKCGPSQMNEDLQTFLKVKEYPFATIRFIKTQIPNKQSVDAIMSQTIVSQVELTLAGVSKTYTIPVTLVGQQESYLLSASLDLNICEFNLDPPVVMMGMIRVEEEVKIHFQLKASITTSSQLIN